jgi:hypothetical protein
MPNEDRRRYAIVYSLQLSCWNYVLHPMRLVLVRRVVDAKGGAAGAFVHIDGVAARNAEIEEACLFPAVQAVIEARHHLPAAITRGD